MNSVAPFNGLGTKSLLPTGLGRRTGRLNGWFGRLLKSAIVKVTEMAADYINGMTAGAFSGWLTQLTNAAHGIGGEIGGFWYKSNANIAQTDFFDAPGYDDELVMTATEEASLMNWVDTKFQPFYNALLLRVTQLTTNKNIAAANVIVEQIIIVKALYAFYKGKQDGLLTANATSNRSTIVNYLLDQQLKIVGDAMTGLYQKPSKITPAQFYKLESSLDFTLSVLPTQIDGYQFTTEKTNTPVNTTSVVATVTPTGVSSGYKLTPTKIAIGVGVVLITAYLLKPTKKSKK